MQQVCEDDTDDEIDDRAYGSLGSASAGSTPRVIWSASGSSGMMFGRNNIHCDGCLDVPWPDCAACGLPAIIALRDPDGAFPHSMSLCAGCWSVVLASREAQPNGRRPHRKGERYTAAELARVKQLREKAGWTWRQIAAELNAEVSGMYRAYHRANQCRPLQSDGVGALSSMLAVGHPPGKPPMKRQRPASSVSPATTPNETREPSPTEPQMQRNNKPTRRRAPSQKTGVCVVTALDASRVPAPSTEDKAMRVPTSRAKQRSTTTGRRVERKAIGNDR